ncbi:hypothetical protein HK099_004020 [Clydaea vesicula]|uniref:Protein kinase domain-containing protein n=1 Tax=Clydaea vesicula TaxID=447962 RepID=A0AAD5XYH3_9FUNG|nr:hypothetical protein HK099_004020 [Clydaea vesicula]
MIFDIPQSSLLINYQYCQNIAGFNDCNDSPTLEKPLYNLELLLKNRKPTLKITSDLKKVLNLKNFKAKLHTLKTVEEAENLYFKCRSYAKQPKIANALAKEHSIYLDNLYEDQSEIINKTPIFFANNKNLILKIPVNLNSEKPNECRVCESLELANITDEYNLVPVTAKNIKVQEDSNNEKSRFFTVWFLVMPKFDHTLADKMKTYSDDVILNQTKKLIKSLNYLHNKGFVHMDIKLENIFVKSHSEYDSGDKDEWFLGDFGSAVMHNTKIISCTQCFLPNIIYRNAVSHFKYDWWMLGINTLILYYLNKVYWKEILYSDVDDEIVSVEKVKFFISAMENECLKSLLSDLIQFENEKFTCS